MKQNTRCCFYVIGLLFVICLTFLSKNTYEHFTILSAEDTSPDTLSPDTLSPDTLSPDTLSLDNNEDTGDNKDNLDNKFHNYDNKFMKINKTMADMDNKLHNKMKDIETNASVDRIKIDLNKENTDELQNKIKEAEKAINSTAEDSLV